MRLIKKYYNRRLYDTRTSEYITLEDVRKLVQNGTEVVIVERETKVDITRQILTRLLPEIPLEVLVPVIRGTAVLIAQAKEVTC